MRMIECPRCGFAQPEDRYCASCGLNIDQFLAKPKPIWIRLIQNPNFHLTLIGVLIAFVVGWIFYSQAALVTREVGAFLDLPIASRDAAEGEADAVNDMPDADAPAAPEAELANSEDQSETAGALSATADDNTGTTGAASATEGASAPEAATKAASGKASDPTRLEVRHYEIPREVLTQLVVGAERVSEGTLGRAYSFAQGAKVADALSAQGVSLGSVRNSPLQANAQVIFETPATASEAFQFAMLTQVSRLDAKDIGIRFETNLVLPQPEPPGSSATSETPVLRTVIEGNLNGAGTLTSTSLLLLVLEPNHRLARPDYVSKAGDGPWTVFNSQEYRSGFTDWVAVIQLK